MMSISMIAPAFAANPWNDLWSCITSGDVLFQGTEGYVKGLAQCEPSTNPIQAPELDLCETKRGTAGHIGTKSFVDSAINIKMMQLWFKEFYTAEKLDF